MRAMLVTVLLLPALPVTTLPAQSDETPVADPPASESSEIAESTADADATPRQAAADKDKEFRIPPGFRVKKRGEFTVYCRKEEVMGTRLQAEIML